MTKLLEHREAQLTENSLAKKLIPQYPLLIQWWFSVGTCKYNLGHKSHDLFSLVEDLFFTKNPLQDLLSSLNAVISPNESTRITTGHVIYNPAYTYKFQLKTTLVE